MRDSQQFVCDRVHTCFWKKDLNCAVTTLLILSEHFGIDLNPQVVDAASVMHGAGGYRVQCGLVEGMLLFTGIIGHAYKIEQEDINSFCRQAASAYEEHFGSLRCEILRPNGFNQDDPPHLCEKLAVDSILQNLQLLKKWLKAQRTK